MHTRDVILKCINLANGTKDISFVQGQSITGETKNISAPYIFCSCLHATAYLANFI